MKKLEIQTDQNCFKYYDSLPEGWSVAVESDFFSQDNLFIMNKPFLVQSFHSKRYEAYRTRSKNLVQKLKPWLDDGRVYVMK